MDPKKALNRKLLVASVFFAWATLVFAFYYRQLWRTGREWIVTSRTPPEAISIGEEVVKIGAVCVAIGLLLVLLRRLLSWSLRQGSRAAVMPARVLISVLLVCVLLIGVYYGLHRSLPYFQQAFLTIAKGFLSAGSVIISALIVGDLLARFAKWRFSHWRERMLFIVSAGLTALSILSLLLAGLGLYRVPFLRVLIVLIFIAGIIRIFRQRDEYRLLIAETIPKVLHARFTTANHPALKGLFCVMVVFALIAALAPETGFDALTYHLVFPKVWLQSGYLLDLPERYVSLYPMSWELLFGIGMAVGGTLAAKLLHFTCILLCCIFIMQFICHFLKRGAPWVAIILFVTAPTVLWEATTAYIDLALALHASLTVYALLRFLNTRERQWILLAGLNLGMALASKHLALLVLGLTSIGLLIGIWVKYRDLQFGIRTAVGFGLIALLLPLPWYIRSYHFSGNPVFPELYGVFGAPLSRWDSEMQDGYARFLSGFGRPRTLANLFTLPWDLTVHAFRYGGSLGPFFLVLLPASLLALFDRGRFVLVALALFTFGYILLWASPFSSMQLRFLVPIMPLLCILAATGYDRLALLCESVPVTLRKCFYFLFCLALFFNFPPFMPLHEGDRSGWKGWLTHVLVESPMQVVIGKESPDSYLSYSVPSYRAWQFINTNLDTGAIILTFSDGDHLFSERKRLWFRDPFVGITVGQILPGQEVKALNAIKNWGVTHILFDKQLDNYLKPGRIPLTDTAFHKWYEMVYQDGRFILHRVAYPGEPSAVKL